MKRVLYVAHLQSHIRQFHLWYLKHLKDHGFYVAVATRVDNPEELSFLDEVYDIPFERSPLKLANFKTYRKLRTVMKQGDFEIVHCHTPVAGILTRLGSHGLNHKVYYTAHGFHFFKGAPLINWLIYFPAEFICSFMTDVLFTMNQEDYGRARKWFHHPNIQFIHGVGIDLDQYSVSMKQDKQHCSKIRLISIGELNANKNHMLVFEALNSLNLSAIEYVIAGEGPLHASLQAYLDTHGMTNVHLLGFRKDIPDLLKVSDIFVFPSKREGLSLALMEAMASGLACVVGNIRGNQDLVDDQKGGYVCSLDMHSFAASIRSLVDHPELVQQFGQYNQTKVSGYSRAIVQKELDTFYLQGVRV